MNKPTFDPNLPFSTLNAPSKPAFDPSKDFKQLRDETSEIESLLRGAAQGISLGYSDEITGALESLFTDKSYEQARDESRQAYHQAREDNPISYGTGEIGASIGTAFIPGLGALNAAKGASLATKVGLGALQGGISASGLSEGKNAQEVLADTAIGAGIGGALPIAIDKVIVPGAKALNAGTKKALQKISGATQQVGEDVAERIPANKYSQLIPATAAKVQGFSESDINKIVDYADNPELYRDTKSIEALKNQVDDVNLQNKLKIEGLKTQFQDQKTFLSERVENFKRNLADSAQDFKDASFRLESKYKTAVPPEDVYDDVMTSVANLKKAVSEGSSAAFEVLDAEKVVVPKKDILGAFKETVNKLKIEDNAPIGSVVQKDFNGLLGQIEKLNEYPDNINGSALKRIIQDLDNELDYAESLGDISSRANAAKKQLRHSLDLMLKDRSSTYSDFMSDVERDSKLLQKANKLFGTEDKVLQKVNTLSLDANNTNLETLGELSPKARRKLEGYLKAKYNLKDENFRKLQQRLPEFERLTPEQKNSFIANNRPLSRLEQNDIVLDKFGNEEHLVTESKKFVEDSEKAFKDNYIHPSSTENLIKGYLKPSGPKIEASKKLKQLIDIDESKLKQFVDGTFDGGDHFLSGQNVGNEIEEDLRRTAVAKVFDRSTTNGSRNTLGGSVLAGSIGTGIGGPVGGLIGAGVGGVAGYFSDKLSGILLKGGIDSVHTLKQYAPKLGKFAQPLINAAQRGNSSLAATHFLLSQQNPEYRELMKQIDEEEGQ